jgi:ribosomal protein L6P/L9E
LFFNKLKFKGKGYYIFKNLRNTIAPRFGYSHRLYIYSYYVSVKFLSKTCILLFGLNKKDILQVSFELYYTRTCNIFTNRGIRFAKQIIYKKAGKISSYR